MTQHNLHDTPQAMPYHEQQPFKQAETTNHSESLILMNQSTLQESDVIRIELYAEMPLINRQTVVRENAPIKQHLAKQTTF